MPGGRSLGCSTCKKRKIKCDERRPTCTQCDKSARFCTGASSPFVYEAEMAKAEVAEVTHQKCSNPRRGIRWRPVIQSEPTNETLEAATQVLNSHSPDSDLSSTSTSAVSSSASECLAERLVTVLESTARTGHDIVILGEWLPEMVNHIGRNPALDAAIETLLLLHQNMVNKGSRDEAGLAEVYGRALQTLKIELGDLGPEISTETICATLALCYEGFLGNGDEEQTAWLSHAGGVAALFQACGPARFKTRFEKSLVYFHAPQYTGSALVTGTTCWFAANIKAVLDSPEWSSLFEEDCEYLGSWDQLSARLVPVYAALPALLRDIKSDALSTTSIEILRSRAWELRRRLFRLEHIAVETLNNVDMVEQVPSKDPDSPYRTCYRFRFALVAQPLWLYWRIIIIINNIIQQLSLTAPDYLLNIEELNASSLDAAHHIAMSAEDGHRWMPIASALQVFNLPVAMCAFLRSGYPEQTKNRLANWLSVLQSEFMEPLDMTVKAVLAKYLHAIGMVCPPVTDVTRLEPGVLPMPKMQLRPLDLWENHETT